MRNTQLLINQLQDGLTRRLCQLLTKTFGSKRPTVDWLVVVYCSSANFATISTQLWTSTASKYCMSQKCAWCLAINHPVSYMCDCMHVCSTYTVSAQCSMFYVVCTMFLILHVLSSWLTIDSCITWLYSVALSVHTYDQFLIGHINNTNMNMTIPRFNTFSNKTL